MVIIHDLVHVLLNIVWLLKRQQCSNILSHVTLFVKIFLNDFRNNLIPPKTDQLKIKTQSLTYHVYPLGRRTNYFQRIDIENILISDYNPRLHAKIKHANIILL